MPWQAVATEPSNNVKREAETNSGVKGRREKAQPANLEESPSFNSLEDTTPAFKTCAHKLARLVSPVHAEWVEGEASTGPNHKSACDANQGSDEKMGQLHTQIL